ncbi:transposase [Streptomyces mirabilis]|uniref:transposase n=1 Tax=Streptomyces mirabilis TaxID=68239 RepID=UPI0036684064
MELPMTPRCHEPDRCRTARIPEGRSFATKPELARAMVLRALDSALPIAWVTADAAYGQERGFRRMLEEAGVNYVLAVPKSQQVKSPAGAGALTMSCPVPRTTLGSGSRAGTARRALGSTTGPQPNSPLTTMRMRTARHARTIAGYWPVAAWPTPRRSLTTSPLPRRTRPSPSWFG